MDHVADDAVVSVKVLGLVMVYIPEGSFNAGDNGSSNAALTKGSNDNRPWFITSEDAIEVTDTASDGYYYISSRDIWTDRWNASEDVTGAKFTLPADFPKGYRPIYCMKYELTQQQYVDFLNTLNSTQALNRYDTANFNHFGYTISENNGVYSTTHPDRACGFISPADGYAYADWAGLRPMTELEFEKICRGSGNPAIDLEFAWGTTYSKNAVLARGTETDREYVTNARANSYYLEEDFQAQFPLNAGIFAGPGKSRELSGAAYYGVMEMSTNLSELCVTIGNSYGRAFTYRNGNGQLAPDGFNDESFWPLRDGKGGGYRGGCFANERLHMCISVRVEAALEIDNAHRHIPWGFRGVRTVTF
jgi:formylglycine-generating enzyme required for sulfatase activity